jgi:hypothetical protein
VGLSCDQRTLGNPLYTSVDFTVTMARTSDLEPLVEHSSAEAARIRTRDRKRRTRMVVDNAGVRTRLLAEAARRVKPAGTEPRQ